MNVKYTNLQTATAMV